jgi:hypothetical protein
MPPARSRHDPAASAGAGVGTADAFPASGHRPPTSPSRGIRAVLCCPHNSGALPLCVGGRLRLRSAHDRKGRRASARPRLLARLLHRQSMGALTGRAAFPSHGRRFRVRLKGAAKVAAGRDERRRHPGLPSGRRLAFPPRCRSGDSWPIGRAGRDTNRIPSVYSCRVRVYRAVPATTCRWWPGGRPQGAVEPS